MTKKYRLKLEVEESVSRKLSKDDCPNCGMHFFSQINRDAHKQRYPSHFKDSDVLQVDSSKKEIK